MTSSVMEQRTEIEQRILRRAAEASDGRTTLGMHELSASVRLTDRGHGQWDQRSPFIAGFTISEDGRAAIAGRGL